jgi:FtsZ-binding cell division protein ZapB
MIEAILTQDRADEAEAVIDEIISMLSARNDDLMSERQAALDESDGLQAENIELRKELAEVQKQLASMRGA